MAACAWYVLIWVPVVCQRFGSAAWNPLLQQLFMVVCPAAALGVVSHNTRSFLAHVALLDGSAQTPHLCRVERNPVQASFLFTFPVFRMIRGSTLPGSSMSHTLVAFAGVQSSKTFIRQFVGFGLPQV